jgi:hypothetical protein
MGTQDIINDYLAAWNEPDEAKRRGFIERCWADDGLYCDPLSDGRGRDALNGFIAGMHGQQAGARIELTSGVEQHHNQIRFAWAFIGPDGKRAIEGIDVGELAADGKLARIVGFWGSPPAQ